METAPNSEKKPFPKKAVVIAAAVALAAAAGGLAWYLLDEAPIRPAVTSVGQGQLPPAQKMEQPAQSKSFILKSATIQMSPGQGAPAVISNPQGGQQQQPPAQKPSGEPHGKVDIEEIQAPKLQEIRKEVAENPHQIARSQLQFAMSLGLAMEEVMEGSPEESLPRAEKLFEKLEACVTTNGTADSTRALCLVQARHIASKYDSLKPRYETLTGGAPTKVQKLARVL